FVAALAGGCATARTIFQAELVAAPFTTLTSAFAIEEAPEEAPVPKVSAVTPAQGPTSGGSSVVITGVHLGGAKRVKFGALAARSFTVESESSIEAVTPRGEGTVYVTVTTPAGTTQNGAQSVYAYQ